MSFACPLAQIPSSTDLQGLMTRLSQGFQSPTEGHSVLDLGRGTIIKVHLYKNIAYYYARGSEEKMCCYIFALDMSHPPSRTGIPCQVLVYGPSMMSRVIEASFESNIIGRAVLKSEFVTSYLQNI
ncbi:hypothetical protein DFH28DRAFT_921452 [Melampsora americana]|nr:hypothetical protein DFH28DRAFT_921452 [Melampsora americana]